MAQQAAEGLRVVQVRVYRDPERRDPGRLVTEWRDFARAAAAAQQAGVQVTVVQGSWSDARLDVHGVPCYFVHDPTREIRLGGRTVDRARLPRLFEAVRGLRPDVIHFDGLLHPRQLRALAAAVPGAPIICQDHGSRVPTGWRRWIHRWGFASLAGVAFTARAQAAPFKAAGVLPAALPVYEVIEGSTPFEPGDVAAERAALGLSGDPCLLWVGNLDDNKDPLTVLEAVGRAVPDLPALRLWMCYRHAPLDAAVRTRVASDPALAARVSLVGTVPYPEIGRYLRAADFLLQGSHKEGSGYGVIEALACGTTPLVTDIPSFRVITGGGECGGLSPVGDAPAMARNVVLWAARDRALLRHRARVHFEAHLSFEAIGRQLVAAYGDVAGGRR